MEIFFSESLFSVFNFERFGCVDSILVISETVPIYSLDACLQLEDSDLFEVIVVKNSISTQIYFIINFFGLFK